jgi:hypothetical protein
MSVRIHFRDDFVWDEFEKGVLGIMETPQKVQVIWDLGQMTKIPWAYTLHYVKLMRRIKKDIPLHISKSIVILPSQQWKTVVDKVLNLCPPVQPCEIICNTTH